MSNDEIVFGFKYQTEEVHINDIGLTLTFDVYDGHATAKKDGHVYDLSYPTMSGIVAHQNLSDMIHDKLAIEVDEIEPIHSMQLFSTLYIDGVKTLPK